MQLRRLPSANQKDETTFPSCLAQAPQHCVLKVRTQSMLLLMLSLIVFMSVIFATTTARRLPSAMVPLQARRNLASLASCTEYKTDFEMEASDYGGAVCECSFDEQSEVWVASCLYSCQFCLDNGCFLLSYQRYGSGVEWECLDYSVQSSSAGKLCTLYDEANTELVVAINDEYCLPAVQNSMCGTDYEYDCSNIGHPIVCNANDTADVIWQIAFSESEELCTVGTCDEGRTTTFPKSNHSFMTPPSAVDLNPTSNAEIETIGTTSKGTDFLSSNLSLLLFVGGIFCMMM